MASWAARRKTFISLSLIGVVVLFFVVTYQFTAEGPTCSDGIKNQSEIGVDCGGECAQVCREEISPLITLWSRVFPVSGGRYDAVALLENPNLAVGTRALSYTFKLYDADNILVLQKKGVAYVNPGERAVLFEGNLNTGERVPVRAFVELAEPEWVRLTPGAFKAALAITEKQFTPNPSRLTATLSNKSLFAVTNVDVYAVLSDESGNAYAASRTLVSRLDKGFSSKLIFTWPETLSEPAVIDIYPRVNILK